jgi:hypothetical protein
VPGPPGPAEPIGRPRGTKRAILAVAKNQASHHLEASFPSFSMRISSMTKPSFALAGTLALLASLTFAASGRAGSTTVTATAPSNQVGGGLLPTGKLITKPDDLVGTASSGDTTIIAAGSLVSDATVHEDTTEVSSQSASSGLSTLPVMVDFILMTACPAPSGGTEGVNDRFGGSFRIHLGGFAFPDSVPDLVSFAFLSLGMAGFFVVRRFFTRRMALT